MLYFVTGDLTNGKRKSVACKESTVCNNDDYMFYLEHRKRNTTHIKKRESSQICMLCGSTMESLPCKARKVWEFQDDNFVIVKHHGNHSCELKPRKPDINFDEVLKGGIRKGPTQLQKEYLYDILKKKKSVELLKEAANDIVNKNRIRNHKTKLENKTIRLVGCFWALLP